MCQEASHPVQLQLYSVSWAWVFMQRRTALILHCRIYRAQPGPHSGVLLAWRHRSGQVGIDHKVVFAIHVPVLLGCALSAKRACQKSDELLCQGLSLITFPSAVAPFKHTLNPIGP